MCYTIDVCEKDLMCLEETYPEHEFSVERSFDKSKDCGVFQDENGLKFRVHQLVYDNRYHFGGEDDFGNFECGRQPEDGGSGRDRIFHR